MKKSLIKVELKKGNIVARYGYDECPTSPREWDNLGVIYSTHHRCDADGHNVEELEDENGKIDLSQYIWLTIKCYEHSGITIAPSPSIDFQKLYNDSDGGLGGIFGVIAVPKDKVREEYNCKRITKSTKEKVMNVLEGEIEDLDNYYNGMVYCWEVERDGDVVDSCGGYYDEKYCEDDMQFYFNEWCTMIEEEEIEKALSCIVTE